MVIKIYDPNKNPARVISKYQHNFNSQQPLPHQILEWISVGVVPKNWMDLLMKQYVCAADIKLMNSMYNISVDGYKTAYKELVSCIGTAHVKSRVAFYNHAVGVLDTTNAIRRAGYNMPNSVKKIIQTHELYHEQIIKYKAGLIVSEEAKIEYESLRYIQPFIFNGYKITQLITPFELSEEGTIMGHCVGGYDNMVFTGASVLFSIINVEDHNIRSTVEYRIRETVIFSVGLLISEYIIYSISS